MLRHTTFSSCGEVTTATIATAPKNTTSTTFRSISGFALPSLIHPDSQQATSPIGPIGFLFLKLLPPPRAVLLVRIWFFDSGKCFPTFLTETWIAAAACSYDICSGSGCALQNPTQNISTPNILSFFFPSTPKGMKKCMFDVCDQDYIYLYLLLVCITIICKYTLTRERYIHIYVCVIYIHTHTHAYIYVCNVM